MDKDLEIKTKGMVVFLERWVNEIDKELDKVGE
jgi:hypothetical protein